MSLALRARAAAALLELAFNPHQRRDSRGRWAKMPDSELKRPRRGGAGKSAGGGSAPARLRELDRVGKEADKRIDYDAEDLSPETREWADRLFAYEDPVTGFKTRVSRLRAAAAPGGHKGRSFLDMVVDVEDASGKKVGSAHRKVMETDDGAGTQVWHVGFYMDKKAQGGGFSSRWLRQMEDRYREVGIDRIATTPTEVGGYAWAKAGFDFEDAKSARDIADRVDKRLRSRKLNKVPPKETALGKELARRARSDDEEERPTPMEFAMWGWTPGAETWPGKETMIGSIWQGVKKL